MATTLRATSAEYPDEENVLLQQLLRRMNFSDRVYASCYLLLTIAMLVARHPVEHLEQYLILNAIILATINVTSWNTQRSRPWTVAHDCYPMLLFVVAFEEVARLSLAFVPNWHDAWLLRLEDVLFGHPPTLWLGHFQNPLLSEVLEFGYFSFYWLLPVVGIVLYGNNWERTDPVSTRPFRLWIDALTIGYVTCFALYLLFPTEGPAHTLPGTAKAVSGTFRWLVLLIQNHGGVHGNAFPSAHIMAAVSSLLAALKWSPRLGRWLIVPVLLMCIGAVYDSYHYVSDVVAGAALGAVAFAISMHLLRSRAHGVN